MKKLAVFASGRGSNFRAIVEHVRMRVLENVDVKLLVTNNPSAPAVTFAEENLIPCEFIQGLTGKSFATKADRESARNAFDEQAFEILNQHGIDLVALAGFMQILGPKLIDVFRMRIMNIHPAKNMARFGGRGMVGRHVHIAVIQARETESGCTIHYVDNSVDSGPVVLQSLVPVAPTDTPEKLEHRILLQEHRTYSKAIQLHVDERLSVANNRVLIDWSGSWEQNWNRRQEPFVRKQSLMLMA
jgi:phosphoribosylglycinamide formyltransferase-1